MKIGHTGNIYVGGYTCSELSKNGDGTYMVTYEPENDILKSVAQKQFPESYDEIFPGGPLVGFSPNQTYSLVVRDIYEFSNGTAALLGEQRQQVTYRNQNGSVTYFFVRNVVYSQTNTTGEIEKLTFFDRKAVASSYASVTYYPMFNNDKIYVMYADHVNNYAGKEGYPFKRLFGGDKKYCCSLLTIDNTGNGEIRKLFDPKQIKNQIVRPLFIEDDGIIVLDFDKKGTNISKLKVAL